MQYRVERMTALDVEQMTALDAVIPSTPASTCFTLEAAEQAAREWTLSDPWRRHAYVLWQDAAGYHRDWYHRTGATDPRPLVVVHE